MGKEGIDEVTQRASQPVEPPDEVRVALSQMIDSAGQSRTVSLGTAGRVAEDAFAARRLQCFELEAERLFTGRDAGIAILHRPTVTELVFVGA
jgi:hypothetical protein